jgi:hypothetical protein
MGNGGNTAKALMRTKWIELKKRNGKRREHGEGSNENEMDLTQKAEQEKKRTLRRF